MVFTPTNTVGLVLFLAFFAVFLFKKSRLWVTVAFGFASMFLALALGWSPLALIVLGLFIGVVIFSYARSGRGGNA